MKQTMKVGVVLLSALTIALWFGISSTSKKKEDLELQVAGLENQMNRQESAFSEVMDLIVEVEDQIGDIVEKENLVYGQSQEPLNSGKKENILKEIAMIDNLIIRSNANIQELTDKVKSSDLKLGIFQKRINSLQADLFDRQTVITDLKAEISLKDQAIELMVVQADSLSSTLNAKVNEIGQKDLAVKQLTALNDELNKGYMAIGTFEELQEKGVVDKEGGFLGFIGRTVALQEDAESEMFIEFDKREISQLRIQAAELALVSNHPSGSYSILPTDEENIKILEITDPEAFWQISQYLVISKSC